MDKILITGASGFVGQSFIRQVMNTFNGEVEIVGISRTIHSNLFTSNNISYYSFDLFDVDALLEVLVMHKPNKIVHLAAMSSVALSWKEPQQSFSNNTNIFLNLLETVRKAKIKTRILSVGSSEQYGIVKSDDLPIKETTKLHPISPYAVARVSQEMLCNVYIEGFDIDIVMTRSFNHFGAGQDERFFIPSMIHQVLRMKHHDNKDVIRTGDLSIIRDYTDVRDVVNAYLLLLDKGLNGEVYNICSGKGWRLFDIVHLIQEICQTDFEIVMDDALIRPNDNPVIVGSNEKIKVLTGWQPTFSMTQSINNIIEYINFS